MSDQPSRGVTRRGFLIVSGAAAMALPGLAAAQSQAPAPFPGKERLIVRSSRPVNLETKLGDFTAQHTPEELFYVRNNYEVPSIDPAAWTLHVDGLVEQPLVLRLVDLRRLPAFSQDSTLECAGNGRSFHRPRASGIQWEYGAVGNARWTGVRLADVLALARPRATAGHVAFDGADRPPTPQAPDFIRSVPLWKALERHTMIALEMNGKPVSALHGGPARVVVPGFVGSASIKWLERITLRADEFDGGFMTRSYRAPRAEDEKETYSLQSLEVKSLIVAPADGARVTAGRTTVWGWAWAGEGELTGLDVSTNGGQDWAPARFVGTWDRYSWRKWEYDWDAAAGAHTVMARATDSLGRIQPATRARNPLGYRWNAIHAIKVDVG
jgi:DMSO/TMAO reductase YedYZ molybdopterin-dependent catalytic subunit